MCHFQVTSNLQNHTHTHTPSSKLIERRAKLSLISYLVIKIFPPMYCMCMYVMIKKVLVVRVNSSLVPYSVIVSEIEGKLVHLLRLELLEDHL